MHTPQTVSAEFSSQFLTTPNHFAAIYFNTKKIRIRLYVTKTKLSPAVIGLEKETFCDSFVFFIQLSLSFRPTVRF